jgi:signal transduction histidine kinase
LFSMEERARLIGARLEVRAELGKGTHIEVWVPTLPSQTSVNTHIA